MRRSVVVKSTWTGPKLRKSVLHRLNREVARLGRMHKQAGKRGKVVQNFPEGSGTRAWRQLVLSDESDVRVDYSVCLLSAPYSQDA